MDILENFFILGIKVCLKSYIKVVVRIFISNIKEEVDGIRIEMRFVVGWVLVGYFLCIVFKVI